MKFKKKPVVVEARQLDGGSENLISIARWIGRPFIDSGPNGEIYIETLEGEMQANVSDWIIKGVVGEFYPCRADIFEQTYEAVEGEG